LFPNKASAVQQLKDAYYQRQLNCCNWFTDFITQNREDIFNVTFYTDEVWFHLSCHINMKTTCLWCTETHHEIADKPSHSDKIATWVAISRRHITGSIVFTKTVHSEHCCLHTLFPLISRLHKDEIN
jgi:hypothetical protein